ncbi:ATP-binding protein [Vibrio coralliilyticus]|uniref:Uncharacterized protein n=3 Tax=Vibrio TaxID=662 RepID=A0AAN0SJR5_9VIBR|nr:MULTISPECIES: AAA family ATPase [Vibrio]CAH1582393.1 conserved hypothetical protein [Vibrio jasicida]AIW22541.1 hypothetical protein IX92_26120 [Vibrio coralliilyticus]MCZ2802053.1 hypothetical protein [Vibrio alginolyticus]NOH36640.1 ATP-binding protein [Vibrio coralliilyticus]POB46861.1 hypothetical protein CRN52_12340 [Vibrio vulnificus]
MTIQVSSDAPHCITMIGFICSGKTEVCIKHPVLSKIERADVDTFIFDAVKEQEFPSYKLATQHPQDNVSFKRAFWDLLGYVKDDNDSVIIDRLNIHRNSRQKLLSFFPDHNHIAINIHAQLSICKQRYFSLERELETNGEHHLRRELSSKAFNQIGKSLHKVSLAEGYTSIIHLNQFGKLMFVEGEHSDFVRSVVEGLS